MEPEARPTETENSKTGTQYGLTEVENSKTDSQDGLTVVENSKTSPENSLTEINIGKTAPIEEENEGTTPGKTGSKSGRAAKPASTTAVTWSIRGVERETRAMLEKAAVRADKTLGQYFNDEVRAFVQSELSQTEASQLPASPRDLQVQVEQLTQMVEGIAARLAEPARKGFWQRVFGK
jgi:hypothetical protein